MEKFETQYSNLSGKTETIASTNRQLQESPEIFESPSKTMEYEMGDIADAQTKE